MKHPTYDAAGYPSDDTLDAIATWTGPWLDLVRFVDEAWLVGEGKSDLRTECWFLRVGRWKGNKYVAAALNANPGFKKFLVRHYEDLDTYAYNLRAAHEEDEQHCGQGMLFEESIK